MLPMVANHGSEDGSKTAILTARDKDYSQSGLAEKEMHSHDTGKPQETSFSIQQSSYTSLSPVIYNREGFPPPRLQWDLQ